MRTHHFRASAAVLTLGLIVAACGSDSGGSSSGATTPAATATTPAAAAATTSAPDATTPAAADAATLSDADLTAAAEAAAGKAGAPVTLEKKKVGIILIAGVAEIIQRMQEDAQAAADALGWELLVCDAQGDPAKMQQCGDTLLNQGANALIDTTIQPSVLQAQIQRAKSMNVPFINVAGVVDSDDYLINLSPEPGNRLGCIRV
jgi:ABC-type sugar transport system substrate-binding protein